MENITTGHWIFAGISILAFIGYLIWSYYKESSENPSYYKNSMIYVLAFLVIFMAIYIFKRLF